MTPDYGRYDHMGATLTEAIVQQGLKWDAQVKPLVNRVRDLPAARTSTGFLKGFDIQQLVGYGFKGRAVKQLAEFFVEQEVETESDLREWLIDETHLSLLRKQYRVGPKTIDYLKNLVGMEGVAVDTHISSVATDAGIPTTSTYVQLKALVESAATLLGTSGYILDYSIWAWRARESASRQKDQSRSGE